MIKELCLSGGSHNGLLYIGMFKKLEELKILDVKKLEKYYIYLMNKYSTLIDTVMDICDYDNYEDSDEDCEDCEDCKDNCENDK